MFQNLLYDVFILNKADNLHGSLALRAGERINLPPEADRLHILPSAGLYQVYEKT